MTTIPSYHDVSHFSGTYYSARCLGSTQRAWASSLAVMVWAAHCTPRSTFFCLSSERILKSSPSSLPRNHFHSLKKKNPATPIFKFHKFQETNHDKRKDPSICCLIHFLSSKNITVYCWHVKDNKPGPQNNFQCRNLWLINCSEIKIKDNYETFLGSSSVFLI